MSNQTIPRHPLQWPAGWKRTPSYARKSGTFRSGSGSKQSRISVASAVERVRDELGRMGIREDDLVVSTNLQLRLDGMPRSNQGEPADRVAAVYWRNKNTTRCMAIDRYDRVADNLAAIAATLEAMRAIERHGGAEILERAFSGFAALPAASTPERPWYEVLGLSRIANTSIVRTTYLQLRGKAHPDAGGSTELFNEIQNAWTAFCSERGISP